MAQWSTRIGPKPSDFLPKITWFILVLHWAMDVIYDFYNKKAMEQEWFRSVFANAKPSQ